MPSESALLQQLAAVDGTAEVLMRTAEASGLPEAMCRRLGRLAGVIADSRRAARGPVDETELLQAVRRLLAYATVAQADLAQRRIAHDAVQALVDRIVGDAGALERALMRTAAGAERTRRADLARPRSGKPSLSAASSG